MTWFDNFDFKYRGIMPTFSKATFSQFNWTGVAVRPYHGLAVTDLKVEWNLHGHIPSMPSDLFGNQDMVFEELRTMVTAGQLYLSVSLVDKFQVNSIPLKPIVDKAHHPIWFNSLSSHADGLKHLLTKEIRDIPIGTNVSLINFVKEICGPKTLVAVTDDSKYQILNSDMNLYQRVNKVVLYTAILELLGAFLLYTSHIVFDYYSLMFV